MAFRACIIYYQSYSLPQLLFRFDLHCGVLPAVISAVSVKIMVLPLLIELCYRREHLLA